MRLSISVSLCACVSVCVCASLCVCVCVSLCVLVCSGVVLDSGDGVSHCVPVFEGYCLPHAVQRFDLAGSHVTLQLQKVHTSITTP